MTAIRLRAPGGLDQLYASDAPAAAPGPGEIRVRIEAASLNYHDYLVATGFLPNADGRIPLSDGGGTVEEVGPGVVDFKPGHVVCSTFFPDWHSGDAESREAMGRVPGDGSDGYARTFVTAAATDFTLAPTGYEAAEAATLPCAALTAWRALFIDVSLKPGDSVLVQGTGGVSIFALQFAKAAGAQVIATSSSEDKLARLRELGADHVINYREDATWGKTALKLTGGRGVDHVIEVGGINTLEQSMIASRIGAHIAIIGVVGGFEGAAPIILPVQNKRLKLEGVTVGTRADQIAMIRGIERAGIRPVIDTRRFPLQHLADAFRHQESGKHFGKICINI